MKRLAEKIAVISMGAYVIGTEVGILFGSESAKVVLEDANEDESRHDSIDQRPVMFAPMVSMVSLSVDY
jgi:hypothetical protein